MVREFWDDAWNLLLESIVSNLNSFATFVTCERELGSYEDVAVLNAFATCERDTIWMGVGWHHLNGLGVYKQTRHRQIEEEPTTTWMFLEIFGNRRFP